MYAFIDLIQKCLASYENNRNNISGMVHFYKAYIFSLVLLEIHKKIDIDDNRIKQINDNWRLICYTAFKDSNFKDTADLSLSLNTKISRIISKDYEIVNKFLYEFKEYSLPPEWWTKKGMDIRTYSDTLGTEELSFRGKV